MGQYATNFTTQWERNDTEFTKIGTGMTVNTSNGHFTFPSTGIWLIMVHWMGHRASGSNHFAHHYIWGMNDGNQSNGFDLATSAVGNGSNDNRNTASMNACLMLLIQQLIKCCLGITIIFNKTPRTKVILEKMKIPTPF